MHEINKRIITAFTHIHPHFLTFQASALLNHNHFETELYRLSKQKTRLHRGYIFRQPSLLNQQQMKANRCDFERYPTIHAAMANTDNAGQSFCPGGHQKRRGGHRRRAQLPEIFAHCHIREPEQSSLPVWPICQFKERTN